MPTLLQRLAEEQREIGGVSEIIGTGWKRLQNAFRRPRWAFSGIVALLLITTVGGYLYRTGFLSIEIPSRLWWFTVSEAVSIGTRLLSTVDCAFVPDVDRFLPRGCNLDVATTDAATLYLEAGKLHQCLHAWWTLMESSSWGVHKAHLQLLKNLGEGR